jgi:hypothetical protein
MNHAVNEAMAKAVEEWFQIKDAPNAPSKAAFARQKQVKPDTFYEYVQDDPDKRRKLKELAILLINGILFTVG